MLISVLNATYGSEGYDFSSLKYSNFVQLDSYKEACAEVNSKFMRISKIVNDNNFVDRMWKSIDDVIQIAKCNVFRYVPETIAKMCLYFSGLKILLHIATVNFLTFGSTDDADPTDSLCI